MKSIKEKAEEYGYTNWQSDEYHDGASEGLKFDAIGHTQKMFEAGANYVLEEIDYILMDKDLDCEEKCNELIALVKQLKK